MSSIAADVKERAQALDRDDPLSFTRSEFNVRTLSRQFYNHEGGLVWIGWANAQLPDSSSSSGAVHDDAAPSSPCVYLCGNSLGLQPKRTPARISQYLATWATQGVQGHFKPLEESPLPTWLDADARAAELIAPIVGATKSEVAVMQTLTANLHLLMSAFYHPDINGKHKIILESRAFPSDHFAVETQLRHHGLSPEISMVVIESPHSKDNVLTTYDIQSVISTHAATTSLLLLPGIQYYTGQLLDIPLITAFAHKHDIFVIWDLAHAVGNVPLSLHSWEVDAAAWCSYKYLNSGPGCIGGLFVHERHSAVTRAITDEQPKEGYRNRLAGWWGNDKKTRFAMANKFHPVGGAAGFQLSNPSILDITSLSASLEMFQLAGGIKPLREKSLKLTAFLESLLQAMPEADKALFRIITPSDPEQRGAQLSILLAAGFLLPVMKVLKANAVIVDERKPDVIRVAPAPLYNTFEDCVKFVEALSLALEGGRRAVGRMAVVGGGIWMYILFGLRQAT
ncbi:pyridoxal phosphate-dependent transferase [Apodospora peruviana]|uniref:Kynureninase n=1 Tax=Apodospora peruviana TaxID=516989 RepID=A0AAE0IBS9_9PEZI|nr:pyridoxal phosphate-dependent transferase [Apodospora peruviana]